jgi:hypothetical protein
MYLNIKVYFMAKRYVTIDFLRGLAIALMVYLHIQMRWIDKWFYINNMATTALFNLFALLAAIFFGSWCGFFLLVSAIGNMISMQKGLQAGQSPLQIGVRQVVGGVILLIFAWLTEAVIGYHGTLGILVEDGLDPTMIGPALLMLFSTDKIFYAILAIVVTVFLDAVIVFILLKNEKENHSVVKYLVMIVLVLLISCVTIFAFAVGVYGVPQPVLVNAIYTAAYRGWDSNETIHAVAYCVIITGIVQTILSLKGGFKKAKRNVIIYSVLAILILIFTPFVWEALYSYRTGVIGVTPAWELYWTWVLHAYDGAPEPLFPFLAEAFIGAILGIWLTQDKPNRKVVKFGLWACLVVFWVGLAGTIVIAVSGDMSYLFKLLDAFWNIPALGIDSSFVEWEIIGIWKIPALGYEQVLVRDIRAFGGVSSIWFWWFICLTAAQVAAVFLIVRLIEFRGRGQAFLKGTQWVRRFGFVAFTIYNFQFIDVPIVMLYSLLPNVPEYNFGALTINDPMIWPLIIIIFLWWNLILILWEKVDYVFSMEWIITKIAGLVIPSKRDTTKHPWWKLSRLDAKSMLVNIEPINFRTPEEVDHEHFEDSRVAYKLAIVGFIFFPVALASWVVVRQAKKTEKPNRKLKAATIMTTIELILMAISTTVSIFLSIYLLTGISSLF